MELALGKYVIPAPSSAEIDELMSLPEGTPVQRGEEIRHTIFELLVVIVEQDPPKLPENYFCNEFCQLIDMCLQVRSNSAQMVIFRANVKIYKIAVARKIIISAE